MASPVGRSDATAFVDVEDLLDAGEPGPRSDGSMESGQLSLDAFIAVPAVVEDARREPVRGGGQGFGMRTARVVRVSGRSVELLMRGAVTPVSGCIPQDVDVAVVAAASTSGDAVLVETSPGEMPVVVGVLQTKLPEAIHLKATTITLEAANEVVLRSGQGAVRIREDGNIEMVGSRIYAASRGLFRIVGRILRLN